MHLITGFILTALLGKSRSKARVRLPSFPGILEVVHTLPGRIRLRAPDMVGRRSLARNVRERLERLDGVAKIEVNSASGSILLTYDVDEVEPEILLAAVIRLLGLEERIESAPRSRVGHEIRSMGAALNRAVHDQTGGLIDLWTGLPLVLAAIGVKNLVSRNGQTGWPLLWWAYISLFPPGRRQDS